MNAIQRMINHWTKTIPKEEGIMATLSPEQRKRWKEPGPTRAEAAEHRRRGQTYEELHLMDMCREFIGLRVHHQQALRAHRVDTRQSMAFDVEHEKLRSRILRQLDLYLAAEVPMISPTKEMQIRSIIKARRGGQDLHLDDLPEGPVKTTYNKRTGVTSATYRDGETHTYTPARKGATVWNPITETWESPTRRNYVGGWSA
ncbi:MAG TPA: hypothetical protein VKA66_21450 [Mycobacterium sp.]|nr:hypothetical protein [Mycobacterium sp.]